MLIYIPCILWNSLTKSADFWRWSSLFIYTYVSYRRGVFFVLCSKIPPFPQRKSFSLRVVFFCTKRGDFFNHNEEC